MKRIVLACSLAAALASAERASAQPPLPRPQPNPFQRPAVSPYMNLARPGNAGVNYYGLVRPQFDTAQQIQQLQVQQGLLSQLGFGGDDPAAAGGNVTGHTATFGNLGHYYGPPGGGVRPLQVPISGFKKQ